MRRCTSDPTVTRLVEADWRAFANLRLRALTDTLGTGDRQYLEELAFTAAQWRRRLRAHAQFALLVDDVLVGLIGAQRQSVEAVYLYSLWLEPAVRGRGLGPDLVTAAVEWARTQGARMVTLRVDAGNAAARVIYERLGFGVVEGPSKAHEVTMSLRVG
ncbi:GNAT family N-acetyltransferase [Mycolicibacterium sp. P1-18]|uniref:GNAT family N-acetyltransferase n=1 Tax=Mycolicibacterium sp. P1-18 TaxID=2024615 RepID=UPI0011F1F798|nr:GNAT family N-acetyltransferase [Mycolicibacterium sp. P1-18]KAA0101197.1 GNAT family N-acetyltransferase [Mycolicibacterium sp. P1-18]